MTAVRIKKYKISASGHRGAIVTIPKVKLNDMKLQAGDYVSMYAAMIGGHQVLVLSASDEPVLSDVESAQGRELREYMEAHP
jgi:hypothetical protein